MPSSPTQVNSKLLTANLIALRAAIDDMLLQINGVEPEAKNVKLTPEECAAAGHPNKRYALGGYWTCLCGAKGKDANE